MTERSCRFGPTPNRMTRRTVNTENSEPAARGNRLEIPWDLSEWADRPTLLRWIVADIDTLDWGNAELVEFLRTHPDYRPKLLLQLLTYAYATSAFESSDVESLYNSDPTFRSLDWDQPLKLTSIRRFRRENRGLFKWTLFQVLQKAIRTRFDVGERLLPAGLKRRLVENATERIDLARLMDSAAADR